MTYPQALLIAVAVTASAFMVSKALNADNFTQGQIAVTSESGRHIGSQAFVARADGQVRFCFGTPTVKSVDKTAEEVPLSEQLIRRLEEKARLQQGSQVTPPGGGTKNTLSNELVARLINAVIICSEWT